MRICEPETATENVWHVLDVLEGSPAESAGLVPMGDWILGVCNLIQVFEYSHLWCFGGWSGGVLNSENDFYDLVEAVCCSPLSKVSQSSRFFFVRLAY